MTSRIQASVNWKVVTFGKSGHLDIESVNELQRLFGLFGPDRKFILDLKDVGIVDRDALNFLASCKTGGDRLNNCPVYDREWIFRDEHKP